MSEKIKVPYIAPELITELKVSGAFYQSIINSYYYFISLLSEKDMLEVFNAIKEDKINKLKQELIPSANSFLTLILLLHEIENQFKDQTVLKEIDLNDQETINDLALNNTFNIKNFPTVSED